MDKNVIDLRPKGYQLMQIEELKQYANNQVNKFFDVLYFQKNQHIKETAISEFYKKLQKWDKRHKGTKKPSTKNKIIFYIRYILKEYKQYLQQQGSQFYQKSSSNKKNGKIQKSYYDVNYLKKLLRCQKLKQISKQQIFKQKMDDYVKQSKIGDQLKNIYKTKFTPVIIKYARKEIKGAQFQTYFKIMNSKRSDQNEISSQDDQSSEIQQKSQSSVKLDQQMNKQNSFLLNTSLSYIKGDVNLSRYYGLQKIENEQQQQEEQDLLSLLSEVKEITQSTRSQPPNLQDQSTNACITKNCWNGNGSD